VAIAEMRKLNLVAMSYDKDELLNALHRARAVEITLGAKEKETRNIPLECYEFLSSKTKEEQEHIYRILLEMDKYKKN